MRFIVSRAAALVILLAIFGGQLSDVFDRADRSPQVKNDPDYMIVVAAACAGFAFLVAKRAASLLNVRSKGTDESPVEESSSVFWMIVPETSIAGPSPPSLLPLRI